MPDRRVVVVTGTGTGIGKTQVSVALLLEFRARGWRTAGLKAVETGVGGDTLSDATRLADASTFHVQHPGYAFPAPLSPHLAARDAGAAPVRIDVLLAFVESARQDADLTLVELPGGLFTPLTDDLVNADFVRALRPDVTVLVAPDRLGVLHDVLAAERASLALATRLDVVALVAPPVPDASTGRNAPELRRISRIPSVVEVQRARTYELAQSSAIRILADLATLAHPGDPGG